MYTMENRYLEDFLQTGAQAFFYFVANSTLPEGKGLKAFLYDEEAVDYCLDHPGKWAMYLAVIVREDDNELLNFSPGVLRYSIPPESHNRDDGVWDTKTYLEYVGGLKQGKVE